MATKKQTPKAFMDRTWREIVKDVVKIQDTRFALDCIHYERDHQNRAALVRRLTHRYMRLMRNQMLEA